MTLVDVFLKILIFGTRFFPFAVKSPALLGSSPPVRCGVTERCDRFQWICLPSNNNDAPLRLLTVGRTTEVTTLGECAFTSTEIFIFSYVLFPFFVYLFIFWLLSTRPSEKTVSLVIGRGDDGAANVFLSAVGVAPEEPRRKWMKR